MKKTIPIGYEDIKRYVDMNLYYVDKTLMLRDFIDSHSAVTLFTRPRRFGKTLNQSMFRRFFEDERNPDGSRIDNGYVFADLAISTCGEKYLQHQQQYPVISLSLKSGKQPKYEMAYQSLVDEIIKEFQRHAYVLTGEMADRDRKIFVSILNENAEDVQYAKALAILSSCLQKYHSRKCIILIDEYDVPLENAWFCGFYDEMIGFIRSLFESALKTNDALEFAMITGCLRISKESIFTGLNNLTIDSVLHTDYGDAFGFTEKEVADLTAYYDLTAKLPEIKQWYDCYLFGDKEIYNPWSIINYVHDMHRAIAQFPRPYWSNTSSNSIIKELIDHADQVTRREIEQLIAGKTLEKPIHEDITYGDIHQTQDNLWNFLFFTGYLKSCGQVYNGETTFVHMAIPNTEIRTIYKNSVLGWFDRKIEGLDRSAMIRALEDGDCATLAELISAQLQDTISFYDYQENYYHGFLTGLLKGNSKYLVTSNRESGTGRSDITLRENKFRGQAMILELKVTKNINDMEAKCREALAQIEARQYETDLIADGYTPILKYGVCFFKKGCMIMQADH